MGTAEEAGRGRLAWVRGLLALAAVAGLLMIILSLAKWVDFEPETGALLDGPNFSFSLAGTELSRVRGPDRKQPADIVKQKEFPCTCRAEPGDGYVVAALGGLIVGTSVAGIAVLAWARRAAVSTVLASLFAFVIAGYNATGLWQGVGARTSEDTFLLLDGDVRAELILLTLVAALPAVLAASVWGILLRPQNGATAEALTAEDAEVWA
jgi:hypothetical protein